MAADQKVGRVAAKKALKQFYQANWAEIDEELGAVIHGETDRGAVILFATVVEDVLEAAIRRNFVDLTRDESARLFGPDAPLGSFSARIRIAYALGVIKRDQVQICDLLREMRNACAHSRRSISFKNKALRDILRAALSYIFDDAFFLAFDDTDDSDLFKLYLMWLVAWIVRYIRTGSDDGATALVQRMVNEASASFQATLTKQQEQRKRSRKGRPPKSKARPRVRPPQSSGA